MGCDPVIFTNNNTFEKNIEYTKNKRLKLYDFEFIVSGELNKYFNKENCLNITHDDFDIVSSKIKTSTIKTKDILFDMYEKLLDLSIGYSFGFGRWSTFIDHLSNEAEEEDFIYYQNCIKKIKIFSSIFGSNKMIIFDSYNNQDIEDDIYDGKDIGIEDIITKERWKIIEKPGINNIWDTNKNLLYYCEWNTQMYFNIEEWKEENL